MNRSIWGFSAAALLVAGAAACAPIQTYSGFPVESALQAPNVQPPQIGVDTRETVQQRFGTPSTTSVMDPSAWYYISEVQTRVAFYSPHITDREVLVVRFDGNTVTAVERYGIERGRIIAYDAHATPTRGRELGVLEQLLGNVGSTAPIRPQDDQQDDPRRGQH